MRSMILAFLIIVSSSVLAAQEVLPRVVPPDREGGATIPDVPPGFPYRTGGGEVGDIIVQSQVPLRDYLSSRIDQVEAKLQRIIDERDRQYEQRFKSLTDYFSNNIQALKDANASSLLSAREASDKAERAINERLALSNEFRDALKDQAATFATKDALAALAKTGEDRIGALSTTIESRMRSIEASLNANTNSIDSIKSIGAGASGLWGYLIAFALFVMAVIGLVLSFRRSAIK